jgi:hypothetical protein
MTTATQSSIGFELREKVAALETALLEKHPRMPTLLREIWLALKAQPENVTLMSEEDIQKIVAGLQVQTQTFLAAKTVGSKSSSKSIQARLANLGDDL